MHANLLSNHITGKDTVNDTTTNALCLVEFSFSSLFVDVKWTPMDYNVTLSESSNYSSATT